MPQVELKDNFLGGLDLDSSLFYVKKNSFIRGLNITLDAIEGSNDTTITNIPGNRLVPYNLPAGTNTCIGRYEDTLRNCVYYFVYNTLGFDSILRFNASSRTVTKILEDKTDTGGIAILNFSLLYKINHINVLHRDEGDLLFWVDGLNAPRKLNVSRFIAGTYGTIEADFISAAKEPPLTVAIVAYGDDSTINTNSLRKRLYKFKYRWVYDDFEKSTWGLISDVALPANTVGNDNDIDPTKNNFISVQVTTGNKDVIGIEIAVQSSLDETWDDFVLATYLVKADLGIADNATTQFNFYNNGVYPIIDVAESNLLFDWLPKKAWAQCFANGNTIIYGAITEGFDPIPADQLNVVLTVANVENTGVDAGSPNLAYSDNGSGGTNWTFTVTGGQPVGTIYTVLMFVSGGVGVIVMSTYTVVGGDTINDVATGLYGSTSPTYQASVGGNQYILNTPPGSFVQQVLITIGPGGGTIASATTWNYNSSYKFGLVYFDQYGRTNGVVYSTAFDITTPNLEITGANLKTPVISGSINHTPPTWAVKYTWVRTKNLTYQNFIYYVTNDFQSDSDYYYFGLQNIAYFFGINTSFIYSSVTFAKGDRIKVLLSSGATAYTTDVYTQDFEILGIEERQLSGGSSSDLGNFIKVAKPMSAPSPAYVFNMLVMQYTPAKSSSTTTTVFYEFGNSYDIYNLYTLAYTAGSGVFTNGETITGGTSGATGRIVLDTSGTSMTVDNVTGTFVTGEIITGGTSSATATINTITSARYHAGMDRNQTNTQSATFTFVSGDIYYRLRTIYTDLVPAVQKGSFNIMDANFSDFFLSAVNGNGRPEVIDVNAKEQYFPVTVRFSQSYLANTSINGMNRFFFENFDDYNRDYGDIRKLYIYGPYMKVGQRYRIGNVPVELSILKNADGTDNVSISDKLLNPIYYYTEEFGVGDCPEAWASKNNSIYFIDNNRGVVCRLSQDGVIPISILYKVNSWATDKFPSRGFEKKIYGIYNARVNRYEFTLEATEDDPAYTMVFAEDGNVFEDERSYQPEMMGCLGTLLVMWENGQLWTNDDFVNYNRFFGIQYPSYITIVFNDKSPIKKKFLSVGYLSNQTFASPAIGDIKTNTINPQTNLQQESQLIEKDFDLQENYLVGALLRDANSRQDRTIGVLEGDFLGGNLAVVKFVVAANKATSLVYFQSPYLTSIYSGRNF